jgi:NADP-dependent 3-hydroxy acid dehydrogenase YdfG
VAGSLEGRKAVVTGASSGIGEATVEALAREGAAVVAGARRRDRLEALAERVGAAGGTVHPREVDVTDEAAARSFIDESAAAMDGLDILINNAGVMLLGPVAGADVEHWRRMINVNLLGLLYCTHAALPIMGEGGSGHIVNVASVAGRRASLGAAVYNMTKFGVVGFSEALRQEALHANVRVTCIEPGFVDTELQGHNELPIVVETVKKVREEIGEALKATDIANAIIYALAQPPHVAINEVLVRPTRQQQ